MSISESKVASVSAIDGRRLAVRWTDGTSGVADLSSTLRHPAYAPLRDDPARFADVRLSEDGWTVAWTDAAGAEIDICPDMLRAMVDPEAAVRLVQEESRWRAERPAAE